MQTGSLLRVCGCLGGGLGGAGLPLSPPRGHRRPTDLSLTSDGVKDTLIGRTDGKRTRSMDLIHPALDFQLGTFSGRSTGLFRYQAVAPFFSLFISPLSSAKMAALTSISLSLSSTYTHTHTHAPKCRRQSTGSETLCE